MAQQDYAGETIAACCGANLHIWRPLMNANVDTNEIKSDTDLVAAAWNRNNKVIATACDNGTIELRYSNGTLMTMLPRGGPSTYGEPLTSLSWSMGSKMLAAGSRSGHLFIHHMTAKTYTSHSLSSHPITSLAYHPDDKFLAIAHGSLVSLWSPDMKTQLTQYLSNKNKGDFTKAESIVSSLSIATTQPHIATATSSGGLSLWDYKTQKNIFHANNDTYHTYNKTAVQFSPLDSNLIWTAGTDGSLLMYDLRSPIPSSSTPRPTARIRTDAAALTCLDIRENYTHIAVGTANGAVLLYDPRQTGTAALDCITHAMQSSERGSGAVTSVHWQHTYQSIGNAARSYAATAVPDVTVSHQVDKYKNTRSTAATATTITTGVPSNMTETKMHSHNSALHPRHDNTIPSPPTTTHNDRLTFVSCQSGRPSSMLSSSSMKTQHHVGPPRKLDLSPIPSLDGALKRSEKGATGFDRDDHALPRCGRESDADAIVATAKKDDGKNSLVSPSKYAKENYYGAYGASTSYGARDVLAQGRRAELQLGSVPVYEQPVCTTTSPSSTAVSVDKAHRTDAKQHAFEKASHSSQLREKMAMIGTASEMATMSATHDDDDIHHTLPPTLPTVAPATADGVDKETGALWTIPARSPVKNTKLLGHDSGKGASATNSSNGLASTASPLFDDHPLRNDILALHLEMLTQFKEQQAATERLVTEVVARHDALADEVKSLRRQLQALLSRRDGVLWL